MDRDAYLTIQVQIPLRGKETHKSVQKWVLQRLRSAGLVGEVLYSAYYKQEFIENLKREEHGINQASA